MQVKTFTGPSTKEIMDQIKAELGPDAIILNNQKKVRQGRTFYEIMAALDVPVDTSENPADTSPSPVDDTDLREEWALLRRRLMGLIKPQMDMGLLTPRQQLVCEYLEREGVRFEVLLDLWEKFRRSPDVPVLSILKDMIQVRPWFETTWEHKFHLLAGPSGSGKSSTALRLALAAKRDRGARVLMVNADKSQGKGRLYLRHYAELSGLAYAEPNSPEQWRILERTALNYDLVFIDLPGMSGGEQMEHRLNEVSGGCAPAAHAHLVLSPLYGSAQMDSFVRRLRTSMTAGIIWTKLDEACNYGEILNQAAVTGLPVSLLSIGSDLKNSLIEPREQDIWKLLLRHKLPAVNPETN